MVVSKFFFWKIFSPSWGNDATWLIFFNWVETASQTPRNHHLYSYIMIRSCPLNSGWCSFTYQPLCASFWLAKAVVWVGQFGFSRFEGSRKRGGSSLEKTLGIQLRTLRFGIQPVHLFWNKQFGAKIHLSNEKRAAGCLGYIWSRSPVCYPQPPPPNVMTPTSYHRPWMFPACFAKSLYKRSLLWNGYWQCPFKCENMFPW